MPFVNRTKELHYLQTLWQQQRPQMVVLYGKRRVGKTALIRQFIQDKPSVYYLADKGSAQDQLLSLGRRIGDYFHDSVLMDYGFRKWEDLFRYLREKVTTPLIMAIDEYPYLTERDAATGSYFQKGWDEYLRDVPIYLILCGSSIAMMESETLSYKAPLYGRRTGQLLVAPMRFEEARLFFEGWSFDAFLQLYAVVGGMPAYLTLFQPYREIEQAIFEQILPTTTFLHNEIPFLLREELREPRVYMAILQAISHGKHRQSEIANAVGMDAHGIQKYLGVLKFLRFIQRITPVTEENPEKSKKGLYHLDDPFVRFWFLYVAMYRSELALGNFAYVLAKYRDGGVHLEAHAYEVYAQDWIVRNSPFVLQRVGKWWDKSIEIDLVALNTGEDMILFGEVKWSRKPIGIDILHALQEKSNHVIWGSPNRKNLYILFSRSGFTPACSSAAKAASVILVHGDKRV